MATKDMRKEEPWGNLGADLGELAFHLLGRGDPAGVPEPQLPIEAAPKGPDLPTGCSQHAEVSRGSYCPNYLPFYPCMCIAPCETHPSCFSLQP